MMLTSRRRTN